MAFDMDILDTLSIDELQAIKDKATTLLKDRKVEVKEKAKIEKIEVKQTAEQQVKAAIAAKILAEGKAMVTFTMNGKTFTKLAGKISDKTVAVDMGADVDTPRKMRYVHFDKIVNVQPLDFAEKPVEKAQPILVKKSATAEGNDALDAATAFIAEAQAV